MKKMIAILLSFVVAFGLYSGIIEAAEPTKSQYWIPGRLTGTQDFETKDKQGQMHLRQYGWEVKNTFDARSRTLTVMMPNSDFVTLAFDDVSAYLRNLSTDSLTNRFLDAHGPTGWLDIDELQDLFSSDPIRKGKIQTIILKWQDIDEVETLLTYRFTVRNGKVRSSVIHKTEELSGAPAQIQTRYTYNARGDLSHVEKRKTGENEDPEYVTADYQYNSKNQIQDCTIAFHNLRDSRLSEWYTVTYHRYDTDKEWPSFEVAVGPSSYDQTIRNVGADFDQRGRLVNDGTQYYYYDSQNRLAQLDRPYGGKTSYRKMVTFSEFFRV